MKTREPFKFNEEQVLTLRDIAFVRTLKQGCLHDLVVAAESAINEFIEINSAPLHSDIHGELRRLYSLAKGDRENIERLRRALAIAAPHLIDYLDQRAAAVIPKLLCGDSIEKSPVGSSQATKEYIDRFPWQTGSRFGDWVKGVPDELLARAISAVVAEGAAIVPGRRRPDGKRSRSHVEPRIRGTTKGHSAGNRGGRPKKQDAYVILIGRLAHAWEIATKEPPTPGRSDNTPFGAFVHQIFSLLDEKGAGHALRSYWKAEGEDTWTAD